MIVDFQNSYLSWLTNEGSFGKFNAEAYCFYRTNEWILGSEVIACNVYNKVNLINEPEYMFQPLFSKSECKIFRTYFENNATHDTVFAPSELFKQHSAIIGKMENYTILTDRSELDFKKHYQCIMETKDFNLQFPIKHLNMKLENDEFQIETGPIIIPYQDALNKGFIAFNSMSSFEVLLLTDQSGKRRTHRIKEKDCAIKIIERL